MVNTLINDQHWLVCNFFVVCKLLMIRLFSAPGCCFVMHRAFLAIFSNQMSKAIVVYLKIISNKRASLLGDEVVGL